MSKVLNRTEKCLQRRSKAVRKRRMVKERIAAVLAVTTTLSSPIIARTIAVTAGVGVMGAALTAAKPAQAAWPFGWHHLGGNHNMLVIPSWQAREIADLIKRGNTREAREAIRLRLIKWRVPPPVALAVVLFAFGHLIWLRYRLEVCANQSDRVQIYFWQYFPLGADPG